MKFETKYGIGDEVWVVGEEGDDFGRVRPFPLSVQVWQITIDTRGSGINVLYDFSGLLLPRRGANRIFDSEESCAAEIERDKKWIESRPYTAAMASTRWTRYRSDGKELHQTDSF